MTSKNAEQTPASDTEQQVFSFHTDQKGFIEKSNNAFLSVSGHSESSLIGKTLNDLRHQDLPDGLQREVWTHLAKARPWLGILKLKHIDGSPLWFKTTISAANSSRSGHALQWVLTHASAGEIKEAERQYADIKRGRGAHNPGLIKNAVSLFKDAPIGKRIGISMALLTFLVAGGLTVEMLVNASNIVEKEEQSWLNKYSEIINTAIINQSKRASSMATTIATQPAVRDAFLQRDRDQLLTMLKPTWEVLNKEHGALQFQFHTPDAHSFARLHKPEKFGDDLSGFRQTVVQANNQLKTISGLEKGKAGYGIRGVVPVIYDGNGIGSVELGLSFGQGFFESFKKKHDVETAFFSLQDGKLKATGSTFGDLSLLSAEEASEVLSGAVFFRQVKVGETPLSIRFSSLKDYSGIPVGVLAVGRDRTPYVTQMASMRNEIVFTSSVAIVLSLLVAFFIARSISRPIAQAAKVSRSIASGTYNNEIEIGSQDETGLLLETMACMQSLLGFKLFEEKETSDAHQRVKVALDYVSTNVTVSNSDGKLIFMNNACEKLFDRLGRSQSGGQGFRADSLINKSMVEFFQDDALKEIFAVRLSSPLKAKFSAWGHTFELHIHPVYDKNNVYQGRVTQWTDITEELTAEQEIEAIVTSARGGDLSRRISLDQKEGFFLSLGENLNQLLDGIDHVIGDIDTAMKRLAKGDLSQPIEKQYSGTFESVKSSVNTTVTTLQQMISQLRTAASDVNQSANEISSGNDELSSRTSTQASSVENTAASLEELTGTVRHNAENAVTANDLTVKARDKSTRGVNVVNEAIGAMGSINESSKKIEEIINVIDEIAFQTNLLALNAAVEAARAGEMGKGFAVVAAEVRNLAGRSADAAKQIKTLISISVDKVQNGTRLVNETGETLNDITASIEHVNNIMQEIASSNQEQSIGIDQINVAVTQLDGTTQQNTALAEQTSSVTESLKSQAAEMHSLVGQFKLNNQATTENGNQAKYLKAV